MTAIRKSRLQYIHFQCLTIKTTKIGYSNDRFGFKKSATGTAYRKFYTDTQVIYCSHQQNKQLSE